ncbi:unnamed protein product [Dovyalis caffra]|uniref:DUF7890 domain-containing protein n=1 Tax=Dovyalis caffra TaxID=77055 RepID=A0AAV1RGZ3_9ROSI|nr:unnamed protein product [Dovyalis caffra]
MLSATTESRRGIKGSNLIYRDELSKEILPKKIKKGDSCLANYKEEDEKKNLEKRSYASSVEEKDVIRVKVKMTKQEAARLMSKCKGGVLEFKDVAHELEQLPVDRVSVMSSNSVCVGVLHSIPEEN